MTLLVDNTGRKPKNQRAKRALVKRQPKIHENPKTALILRGRKTSEVVNQVLTDMALLKKPLCVKFSRHNDTLPFEDESSIQFLCSKNDCSLFLFGNHNKKRPNNLVMGRLYNSQLLDMFELGVENYRGFGAFKEAPKYGDGYKPFLLFNGDEWDTKEESIQLKSMLLDFYRGAEVKHVNLAGITHVLTFSIVDGKVYLRSYNIAMKKSGTKFPRVELEETGPHADLTVRRSRLASNDLRKVANKKAKAAKIGKQKNMEIGGLRDKMGRVHMNKQNLDNMALRRFKGTGHKRGQDGPPDGKQSKKSKPSPDEE